MLMVFMKIKKTIHRCLRHIRFSREMYSDIGPFLKIIIPIGTIVAADWIIYEF